MHNLFYFSGPDWILSFHPEGMALVLPGQHSQQDLYFDGVELYA